MYNRIQKTRTGVMQCYNCQGFRHGQAFCHTRPRCVKCDQDHSTKGFKKTEMHKLRRNPPATYIGCSRFPKIQNRTSHHYRIGTGLVPSHNHNAYYNKTTKKSLPQHKEESLNFRGKRSCSSCNHCK